MQEQVDALGVKLAKEVEQIDQRSANAIDRLGRDHVHLSPRHHLHHGAEPGPLITAFGTRYAGVFEHADDLPLVPNGYRLEFAPLVACRLL